MSPFLKQLQRVRLLIRSGRLFGLILAMAALAVALWLAFGLVDYFAAFESQDRLAITTTLMIACALAAVVGLISALSISRGKAAKLADHALKDPRCSTTAALTMKSSPDDSPVSAFLSGLTFVNSAALLARLKPSRIIPWKWITRPAVVILILAAIAGIFRWSEPGAFETITARLLHPASDLPPHSPFVFEVSPANPSTTYGGDTSLTARITGAVPDKAVECLVRRKSGGEILKLPAFREAADRYSRKLDGLTEPVEIAFAIGRARSKWHPVEILLEPSILSGVVRITPPSYSGLTASEFPLDTNEITALEGSSVTLELASNRPLGSAELAFTPAATPGTETLPKITPGDVGLGSTASYTWISTQSGRILATLKDIRGTPCPRPLEVSFRALPDQAPSVTVSSPPRMMLATPHSKIPLIGRAEDDFALSKVRFIRTLQGFRDRSHTVAQSLIGKAFDFSTTMNLEDLGLEAGQVIELLLEATDHNPTLLGQGASEISRIQIISEDQYAGYIRAKTTISQFAARFRAAREAIEQARESVEKLKHAIENGDEDAIKKAAEAAREAHEKSADLLEKIAGDFPAFEMENRLRELTENQARDLRENQQDLKNLDPAAPKEELQQKAEELLERLGRQKAQEEKLDEDVNKVVDASSLLEMAARFRKIYEDQVSLAKRFGTIVEELRHGEDRNRRLLPSLAETQEKNRKALDDFKVELKRRIEKLPDDEPDLTPMIDSALKFLDKLEAAAPETLMDAATASGKSGHAVEAFTHAENARKLLERLLSEPEPFPEAAMGQAPKFAIPRPDVNENLRQMLEGLLGQNLGQGEGQGDKAGGSGQGPGGMGRQGGSGDGFPMDLPVVGPDRMKFDPLAQSPSGKAGGNGKTGAPPPLPETAESGIIRPQDTRKGNASSISPENIPESYRDAVKKYLTP